MQALTANVYKSKRYTLSTKVWWILTLLALFIFVLCYWLLLQHQDVNSETPPQIPLETPTTITNDMNFLSYSFPSAPNSANTNISSSTSHTSKGETTVPAVDASTALENSVTESPADNSSEPKNERQTERRITEEDLTAINMTITMPSDRRQFNSIGRYLYQCVNIGFAHLQKSEETDSIKVIHDTKYQNSSIFRSTQNALFSNEKHWQRIHGADKQYLRIYPVWFDQNLLLYVNQNLKGEALRSLSATYILSNQLLQLKDIKLNGQTLPQVWTLADGYELGC